MEEIERRGEDVIDYKSAISFEDIKKLMCGALDAFYRKDRNLFADKQGNKEVCERCMVHRIAHYMINEMDANDKYSWTDLDCEYNRNKHADKIIKAPKPGEEEPNDHKSYPDLIIHRRLQNENNLLVAEFKRGDPKPEDYDYDGRKLEYFTSPGSRYRFNFGFYIELRQDKASVEVYKDGERAPELNFVYPNNV